MTNYRHDSPNLINEVSLEHGPVPPHWKLANADDESFILPTGDECDEDPKQSCCVENFYIDFGEVLFHRYDVYYTKYADD